MSQLVFLHTAPVHVQAFDSLLRQLVVADAWQHFENGDLAGYEQCIAAALSQVSDADVIVLAQASMAGARALMSSSIPVLASPELGLRGALAALP